jgi:hypothetical protein
MIIISAIITFMGVLLLYYSRNRRIEIIRNNSACMGIVTDISNISMGHMEDSVSQYSYSYIINNKKYVGKEFGSEKINNNVALLVNNEDNSQSLILKNLNRSGIVFICRILVVFITIIGVALLVIALINLNSD